MANTDLINLQTPPTDPQPSVTKTGTDLLLAPTSVYQRLRHFPEEIYNLSAESKLVKFLKVLLGEAGAGQLRKRLLIQRMQATLGGSHFYALDRFYGPLFGIRRAVSELLDFDPYVETATRDQWDSVNAKDASFRSRIEQFSRALTYGPTPTGMELIAEALLSVDVDVYESWIQADSSYQTYEELEEQYGTNILSPNAFSIEDDGSEWTVNAPNTKDQSTAWSFFDGVTSGGGLASLEVVVSEAPANVEHDVASVEPEEEYSFALVINVPVMSLVHAEIDFFDDNPVLLDTIQGEPSLLTPGVHQIFVTGESPAGSDSATLRVVINDPDLVDSLGDSPGDSLGDSLGDGFGTYYLDRFEFGPSSGTYAEMEDVSYGTLEGEGLARLSGDERRIFTVRPKRGITMAEANDLRSVLYKIKPADSRFTIDHSGVPLYILHPIGGAYSDSEHWEVIPKVASANLAISPYQAPSLNEPVEQPRPPFSGYQGEAWSYVTDLAGVSAYFREVEGNESSNVPIPPVVVTYRDGTSMSFAAEQAILPSRMVLAGRTVSDAIFVSYPLEGPSSRRAEEITRESRLFSDGVPLTDFNAVLKSLPDVDPFQQNPQHRFWCTPERSMNDPTEEVIEIRLPRESLVNYLSFEMARFPHRVIVEYRDSLETEWVQMLYQEYIDSTPKTLPPGREPLMKEGHPQHSTLNHWERVSHKLRSPVTTSRIRLRLRRIEGNPPRASFASDSPALDYSLAIRALDVGYRVRDRADFANLDSPILGTTTDMFGSQVNFEISEQKAQNVLDGTNLAWRSEPQPVNYAVVNLYLDTRNGNDGSVIDRFFIDPTHSGAHISIYYSMDPEELDTEDPEGFMAARNWTPIPRDFTAQRGNLYIPPTRARYWKFEFTNLSAEPYENFLPINRRVKLFPQRLIENLSSGYGHAEEARLPGQTSAILSVNPEAYRDAVSTLRATTFRPEDYRPTEALYWADLNAQSASKNRSWVYGFTPWHQDASAPRFNRIGQHQYDVVEVRHDTKVSFFAGLREIRAYRANFEANDDPTVYFDTYDDFRNLEPGFTWVFEPGYLTTANLEPPVQVESKTFSSLSNIKAVQFATEQSNPVQLVPDSEFRNPALVDYDWNNPDSFLRVGDAQLFYSQTDFSVINSRSTQVALKPLQRPGVPDLSNINWRGGCDSGTEYNENEGVFILDFDSLGDSPGDSPGGHWVAYRALNTHTNSEPPSADWELIDLGDATIIEDIHHPVFSYRTFAIADEAAAAATEGGLMSPLLGLSDDGRVYAAVRFTMLTDQTSPLLLQILDPNDNFAVLAEKSLTARRGETIEEYVHFDIDQPGRAIRFQLIQEGKSNDSWKLFSMALFDESIVWEFSVNGGGDWYKAKEIRNNDNGILTFPEVGDQLRYRATAYRPNLWVSAIKIRPHYVGQGNARPTGTHRGPNVSVYDQDVPIHEDPMFTAWKRPVPYYWYEVSRRFPLLAVEGVPFTLEFSSFFGRPTTTVVPEPDIDVSYEIFRVRNISEDLRFTGPEVLLERTVMSERAVGTEIQEPEIAVSWIYISGIEGGIIHPIIDPVFEEYIDSLGDSL